MYGEYVDPDMLLGLGETEEGPRIDYVQWTHGMPYNNHYGILNLERILTVVSTLAGTPVEFLNPKCLYASGLFIDKYPFSGYY